MSAHVMTSEDIDDYYTYKPEVGYQTRDVSCRDSKGVDVDISLCLRGRFMMGVLPPNVQPCVVAEDCVVSQWSSWTTLQEGCLDYYGRAAKSQVDVRRREVVKMNHGTGRACPHLFEHRVINDGKSLTYCNNTYRWLASNWSPCMVLNDTNAAVAVGCGGGVQMRDVFCIKIRGSEPVSSKYCSMFEPLPSVQRCEVACPRDCEVGEWSRWGPCKPLQCGPHTYWTPQGYRERRRRIQVPASERGLSCPDVAEVQPCREAACYEWVPGQWSPCQLLPGVRHCGEGRRIRLISCRTPGDDIVEATLCERIEKKPPTEEKCLLPCPFDCVVSPWSAWSPCTHSCTSQQQLPLRQRNRTIIAPPGVGGYPCPDPDAMLQIEPCNTHSCHGYSWMTLPWQPCKAPDYTPFFAFRAPKTKGNATNNEEGCGDGMQTREVWCVKANEHRSEDYHCRPLKKPETIRRCRLDCVVNCSVSAWSEWTDCSTDCMPVPLDNKTLVETTGVQVRRRVVVEEPEHGGEKCETLDGTRPCAPSTERCRRFDWGVGNWSDCQLPNNMECGLGYRIREIWCSPAYRKTKVEPGLCMEQNSSIPASSEPCFTDCKWPCVISTWSEWSPCIYTCIPSVRTRELIGLSSSRPSCNNPELFPLFETKPCACNKYELRSLGNLSACIISMNVLVVSRNGRRVRGNCGGGAQYRRTGCFNTTGHLVEPILCGAEGGLEEESCLLPCPVDCTLSEWSAWGECTAICGPGLHNRTRKVIIKPLYGGRPCGVTVQTTVCNSPCNMFRWVAGGWSECQLIGADQERGCGTGDQYRQVRCMRVTVNEVAVEVDDMYCDPVKQPADVNACHVACPGDCVVSPWSEWSPCPKLCDVKIKRQRTRSVLRKPARADYPCPPLIEVQICEINKTCFTYSWQETEFSSCLPLGGSPCGEGIQARAVSCLRSDGRTVEDRFCTDRPKPSPVEKWCYVDCNVDCELTEWGSWDYSRCSCGSTGSAMHRFRYVTTSSSPSGRPCPRDLVQQKPCPVVPCYTWDRGPWSECNIDGAWCGHGTVTRNVTCVRDGEPVEKRLCELAPDLHTIDKCYVPCKGDCQVSEWSHWSHCHRDCQSSANVGYQTRSRAILRDPNPEGEACPTALWETRPCFSAACLTFHWVISPSGTITCQRSDGVVVTGGCDNRPIPCSNPSCEAIPHAYCDTKLGTCICKPGYYSHVSSNQQLTKCTPTMEDRASNKIRYDGELAGAPDEIRSHYDYPRDDGKNVWMYAVIVMAVLFVIFIAISFYVMCKANIFGCSSSSSSNCSR